MSGEGIELAGAALTLLATVIDLTSARLRWPFWLAVGLAAFAFVSFRWAVPPLRSGVPWSALNWGLFILSLYAVPRCSRAQRDVLLSIFAVLVLVSAAFCVLQHYFLLFDHEWMAKVVSVGRVIEPAEGGGYKAGGLHFHRLRFAHTLLPLLLAVGPELWQRKGKTLTITVVIAATIGLYFTYTRAAWIAAAVGLIGFAARSRPVRNVVVLLLLCFPVIAVLAHLGHLPADRAFAWHTAISLWQQHPAIGVGYGGYPSAALALHGGPHPEFVILHLDAHSLLLQVLAELGAIGAIAWLVLAGRFVWALPHAATPVLCALATIGVVHNWAFHPVVLASAALALGWTVARGEGIR